MGEAVKRAGRTHYMGPAGCRINTIDISSLFLPESKIRSYFISAPAAIHLFHAVIIEQGGPI